MRWLIAAALVLATVPTEAATSVQLGFRDGMVWLVARDATLAQVLEEWARVGGTTMVNADQLGGRVSIELNGIPEGQALEMLLRDTGGFLAAQRVALSAAANALSSFTRIVIMPVRKPVAASAQATGSPAVTAPVYQPPTMTAVPVAPGVQRLIGPDGQPVPDDQDGDAPPPTGSRGPGRSLPPGFATPPQGAAPPSQTPQTPQTPQTGPVGSPVPGMIVAPTATPAPQPPRRPSGID